MYKQQLIAAQERISPYIHRTPVFTSRAMDDMTGAGLYFKCENLQRMGAFKMRGAVNAILQLSQSQKQRGVVTHSSGNFAQALSLAAKSLGVKAHIVMPRNAPQVKKDAVRGYGGNIIECEPNLQAREEEAKRVEEQYGARFIHPSNDMDVILGQGTAAMELLQDHGDLELLICPVGGGGLLAGTALAAHYFGKGVLTLAGEPMEMDDAYRSLICGKIETNTGGNTIADGLRTHLGDLNFPIIQEHVDRIVRVTEQEIVQAMRLIWERLKLVCEPSSAVALAAVLREKEFFRGKKTGIILSGGNVDLDHLPF